MLCICFMYVYFPCLLCETGLHFNKADIWQNTSRFHNVSVTQLYFLQFHYFSLSFTRKKWWNLHVYTCLCVIHREHDLTTYSFCQASMILFKLVDTSNVSYLWAITSLAGLCVCSPEYYPSFQQSHHIFKDSSYLLGIITSCKIFFFSISITINIV